MRLGLAPFGLVLAGGVAAVSLTGSFDSPSGGLRPARAALANPRPPTPPPTRRIAPPGSSVAVILDLSAYGGTGDLFSIQHSLDAFGIPYRVTTDVNAAFAAPEMLFIAGRVDSTLPAATLSSIRTNLPNWTKLAGRTAWISALYDSSLARAVGLTPGASSAARGILRLNSAHPLCRYVDTPEELEIWLARLSISPETFVTTRGYSRYAGTSGWVSEPVAVYPDGQVGVVVQRYGAAGGRVVVLGSKFSDLITRMESDMNYGHRRAYSNGFEPSTDTVRLWMRAAYEQWTAAPSLRPAAPEGKRAAVILTHDMDSGTAFPPFQSEFMPLEEQYGVRSTVNVTTSFRRNGWLSSFYVDPATKPIIADALRRGYDVQSHSVSHMPDMTSWAAGSPSDDPATYVPYYSASTGKTTGGTVYPELLISARLLRDDFGIQVRGWRSGHLARPRDLPRLLQATGYWYESNEAAGSNGGALPYLRLASYSSSGPETTVLEVPMSISDNDMSTRTAAQSAALWIDVTYKNAANGAPTVILVHPTRPETKIPAYRPFLDRVATDPNLWVGSMDDWYSWYRAQGIRSQQ